MLDYCGQSIFLITAEVQVEQQEASQEPCNIHLLASEGKKTCEVLLCGEFPPLQKPPQVLAESHAVWQDS